MPVSRIEFNRKVGKKSLCEQFAFARSWKSVRCVGTMKATQSFFLIQEHMNHIYKVLGIEKMKCIGLIEHAFLSYSLF